MLSILGKTGGSSLEIFLKQIFNADPWHTQVVHLPSGLALRTYGHKFRLGDAANGKYVFCCQRPSRPLDICFSWKRWLVDVNRIPVISLSASGVSATRSAGKKLMCMRNTNRQICSEKHYTRKRVLWKLPMHYLTFIVVLLGILPHLEKQLHKILWVGQTEHLVRDVKDLIDQFGLSIQISPEHRRKNAEELDFLKGISMKARCNIERFVSEDYRILDLLLGSKSDKIQVQA